MEHVRNEEIRRFPEKTSRLEASYYQELPYLVLGELVDCLKELQPSEITDELICKVVDLSDWCQEQPRTKSAEDPGAGLRIVACGKVPGTDDFRLVGNSHKW